VQEGVLGNDGINPAGKIPLKLEPSQTPSRGEKANRKKRREAGRRVEVVAKGPKKTETRNRELTQQRNERLERGEELRQKAAEATTRGQWDLNPGVTKILIDNHTSSPSGKRGDLSSPSSDISRPSAGDEGSTIKNVWFSNELLQDRNNR